MIRIENLTKSYGKKIILNNFSLSFEEGKIIGIVGENGTGKSTLLSCLYGILPTEKGSFYYNETDLLKDKLQREKILGYVPQENSLIQELSARDNLRLWYTKKSLENSIQNGMIKKLGIDQYIDLSVKKMSGGMKKKLSIACAIFNNPKILLLDEPTSSLDIISKKIIHEYLIDFKKNGGTALIVTHDFEDLEITDCCYIIKKGESIRYKFDGKIDNLLKFIQG